MTLNRKWMDFRKRRAKHWAFRNKYIWSTCVIVAWGLCSMPDGPFGEFMAKSTKAGINDLFTNDLGPEWTFPRSAPGDNTKAAIFIYTLSRFLFLIVGITLPLPCGVFAPCLAIGAGIGRGVNELMQAWNFGAAYDCNAGGYAVMGAAAMAAGTTRTISSAILIFELTGGLSHVLPVLISVVVAYLVGELRDVSIFDSILHSKGLITMPEFKHRATYHKTARDVMLVRNRQALAGKAFIGLLTGMPMHHVCFRAWKAHMAEAALERDGGARDAQPVFDDMSYHELDALVANAHKDDEYFPYVGRDFTLHGVLHRAQLVSAVARRKSLWGQNIAACRSQMAAATRAYGALERAVTTSPRVSDVASSWLPRIGSNAGGTPLCSPPAKVTYGLPPAKAPAVMVSGTRSATDASAQAMGSGGSVGSAGRRRRASCSRRVGDSALPFAKEVAISCEDINSINYLGEHSLYGSLGQLQPRSSDDPPPISHAVSLDSGRDLLAGQRVGRHRDGGDSDDDDDDEFEELQPCARAASSSAVASSAQLSNRDATDGANGSATPGDPVASNGGVSTAGSSANGGHDMLSASSAGDHVKPSPVVEAARGDSTTLTELILPNASGSAAALENDAMPESWMSEVIPRSLWVSMGLDVAPFCVQAEAPMHLVHFYFSQLTLNAVFVVDRGKFVGMINKVDMINARF